MVPCEGIVLGYVIESPTGTSFRLKVMTKVQIFSK